MTENGRISTAACLSAVADAWPLAADSDTHAQQRTTKKRQAHVKKIHVERNHNNFTPHPLSDTNLGNIYTHRQ